MSILEIALISTAFILVFLTIFINFIMMRKNANLDSMIDEMEHRLEQSMTELTVLRKQVERSKSKDKIRVDSAFPGAGHTLASIPDSINDSTPTGSYEIATADGEKMESFFPDLSQPEPAVAEEAASEDDDLYIVLKHGSGDELDMDRFKRDIERVEVSKPPSIVVDFRNVSFLLENELESLMRFFSDLGAKNIYIYSQNVSEDLLNQFRSKNIELHLLA